MNYIRWIIHNTRGIRLNIFVRIVSGVLRVALGILMVWLCRQFIDETIHTDSSSDVIRMIICLVVVVVCITALRQVYYYLTMKATIRQTNAIRLRIFGSLFRRQLFTEHELHSGDVTSRMSKDIETVTTTSASSIPQMVVTVVQLCGAFLLMRWFDARLAWALLLLTPVVVVFAKMVARKLRQMTLDIREDESRIQMHVQEGMEYNAVLRSLGSEQQVSGRLETMQQHLQSNIMRRTRFTVITRMALGLVFGLGYLLAFVWGGIGLRNGTITFGVMTSFLQLVGMIQNPILQLLNLVPGVIHATASIDRLNELEAAGSQERKKEAEVHKETQGVVFDNVSFSYAKGDKAVLKDFTHRFAPGSKTAIMGETGIGKTTLFRLMLGLIPPVEGRISLCGSDGKQVAVSADTRADFVFVPQGNTLMSGTIRDNLLLAKPDATADEMRNVLHVACADFVMQLPNGLDTELGERGIGLSEGQAQRIAIARGLLRPGTVLLLDEISSALDEQTTRELCQRLFTQYSTKTMIMITHSPAVGELCDEKVFLA